MKVKKVNSGLFSKKFKRRLIKLSVLLLFGLIGLSIYNPNVIKNEMLRNKVEDVKRQAVLSGQVIENKLSDIETKSPISLSGLKGVIPSGYVLGDKDIYVDEAVNQITKELQKIPSQSLEKFRSDFCGTYLINSVSSTSGTDKKN